MKLCILKPTLLLLIVMSFYVDSFSLTKRKTTKTKSRLYKISSDIQNLLNVKNSDTHLISFMKGLLGYAGNSKLDKILPKIKENNVNSYYKENEKSYECNKKGLIEFLSSRKSQVVKEDQFSTTCDVLIMKKQKLIEGINDAKLCVSLINNDSEKCVGERKVNYENWLKQISLMSDNQPNDKSIKELDIIASSLDYYYSRFNCDENVTDTILSSIINEIELGSNFFKFGKSCFQDQEEENKHQLKQNVEEIELVKDLKTLFSNEVNIDLRLREKLFTTVQKINDLVTNYNHEEYRYFMIGDIINHLMIKDLQINDNHKKGSEKPKKKKLRTIN